RARWWRRWRTAETTEPMDEARSGGFAGVSAQATSAGWRAARGLGPAGGRRRSGACDRIPVHGGAPCDLQGGAGRSKRPPTSVGCRSRDCGTFMTLHLVKLCVGCDSIEDLASWQAERLAQRRKAGERNPRLFHRTFQTPKRRDELLA